MSLFKSGLTGMIAVLSLSIATYALWPILWPYVALLIMAVLTASMWAALDAVYRVWHGLIESHPVETAGRVPQHALNQYGRSIDDAILREQYRLAYERLGRVAHHHGGVFSLHGLEPHVEADNWREVWEHAVKYLKQAGECTTDKRGTVLVDYRRFSARLRRGALTIPPCPKQPPPRVDVYARADCKACTAKQGEQGAQGNVPKSI